VRDAWAPITPVISARAADAGLAAGDSASTGVKAQMIYANYLEKSEKAKLALLQEAATWADARREEAPNDPNAHISSPMRSDATARGFRSPPRSRGPHRQDSRCPSGRRSSWHPSMPTSISPWLVPGGGRRPGRRHPGQHDLRPKKDLAIEHFETAIKLFPESAIARIEYANGLMLLFGKSGMARPRSSIARRRHASRPTPWNGSTSSSHDRSSHDARSHRLPRFSRCSTRAASHRRCKLLEFRAEACGDALGVRAQPRSVTRPTGPFRCRTGSTRPCRCRRLRHPDHESADLAPAR